MNSSSAISTSKPRSSASAAPEFIFLIPMAIVFIVWQRDGTAGVPGRCQSAGHRRHGELKFLPEGEELATAKFK